MPTARRAASDRHPNKPADKGRRTRSPASLPRQHPVPRTLSFQDVTTSQVWSGRLKTSLREPIFHMSSARKPTENSWKRMRSRRPFPWTHPMATHEMARGRIHLAGCDLLIELQPINRNGEGKHRRSRIIRRPSVELHPNDDAPYPIGSRFRSL